MWWLSWLATLLSADPDPVTGDMESAMAVELNPWVEYEFRVVASNAIGTGDPSAPSRGVRTKEAGKSSEPLMLDKHYIQVTFWHTVHNHPVQELFI